MKQITIERFCYSPMGTFGTMVFGDEEVYTLEEVWNDNLPHISCIPIGEYTIKRGVYPKHKEAFEVLNVPGRTYILIHKGNTILDIEGCIIPGEKLGVIGNMWGIKGGTSGPAYDRFMKYLEGVDEAKLIIKNYVGGVL